IQSTDAAVYIDVPLNSQAVSDLNLAVGSSTWSVGGALVYNGSYGPVSNYISERVLMNNTATTNDPKTLLVLTGVVPEPATVQLFLQIAVIGSAVWLGRRRLPPLKNRQAVEA